MRVAGSSARSSAGIGWLASCASAMTGSIPSSASAWAAAVGHPQLRPVYDMKEHCIGSSGSTLSRRAAAASPAAPYRIQTLRRAARAALTLARTLTDWIEEIARMWRFTRNNGITEASIAR